MKSRALTAWLAVLFLFAGSMLFMLATGQLGSDADVGAHANAEQLQQEEGEVGGKHVDFAMTNQLGESFDSSSLEGKIWVGSVFFSSCPSTCRAQNLQVAKLQRKFAERGVEFVSLSCDPEKDTPETLKQYSAMFNADSARWHFLTGDFEIVKEVGTDMFGITVERQVHSDRLVLFDESGDRIGSYRSTDVNQFMELEAAIEDLLAKATAEATEGEAG